MLCLLAVSKPTDLPNSQTATLGKPQILQLLLFLFIVIRQQMSLYLLYNNELVSLYMFYKFFLYISTRLQQF